MHAPQSRRTALKRIAAAAAAAAAAPLL
ncbi:twin-arginine translocation signal domain-containing protein, partial [Glycomyces dulcitolivorans]